MIAKFNYHHKENYIPVLILCIIKIMINWLNKYCPGWMWGPSKPHPFGNEYHTICNEDLLQGTPIMFCVKLVEGKTGLPHSIRKSQQDSRAHVVYD